MSTEIADTDLRRALAFFWVGYSISVVTAFVFVAGGIGRGLGGASDFSDIAYVSFASGIYFGFAVAIVSQVWYLLLKPYWETDSIRKLRPLLYVVAMILILIPPTVLYSLSMLSILDLYTPDNRSVVRLTLRINLYLGSIFLILGAVYIVGLSIQYYRPDTVRRET